MSEKYQVSLEATGRAYVTYRNEPVAIIITQHGRVLRYYKEKQRFPFISVPYDSPVPHRSLLLRKKHEQGTPSDIDETDAGVWVNVERGHRAPVLWEQVYLQQQGFAVVMLTLEEIDGDTDSDRDAERTAEERFRDRQARWRQ
jgi:hypothetical protein